MKRSVARLLLQMALLALAHVHLAAAMPQQSGATASVLTGEALEPDTKSSSRFATLPQATASFGAVTSDGWLYIYGGHIAPTHNYFIEAVSGRFHRLRLTGEAVWEELPGGPGLQGMNLVAHNGKIYRIGGMAPRNRRGELPDNHSVADVARFDPITKKWETLAPLPEPRSSHDVTLIGDQLYVTGGWNMTGKSQTWADTLLVMDLSAASPSWTTLPQPFKRRALMTAGVNGKLYVVGGVNESFGIERSVSIYDPATKKWSEGPQLPDGPTTGFAPAVVIHKGRLYASISDGALLRLTEDRGAWEKVGRSTPRAAHRLAALDNRLLVIGGAVNGVSSDLIEAVEIKD